MSISTYGGLKTSVAAWLDRSDLTSIIPDLIYLGQTRIWQDLAGKGGVGALESSVTSTTSGTITLPSDFASVRALYVTLVGKDVPMRPMSTEGYQSTSSLPDSYYLTGTTAVLSPAPDATYSYRLMYYKTLAAFSADADYDTILTKAPHLYLYATLLEAEPYLKNDNRVQVWNAMYTERLNAFVAADRHRFGPMTIRADRVGG
jgi:hypothetical protein